MSASTEQQIANRLESTFSRIYRERMQDMPMVNDSLGVHAVGFQRWQQHYVGVVSTPWFMNLILLPGDADWSALPELGKQTHLFPSGHYEFITAHDDDLGVYQMCSLFSPMFEFADDDAAVDTAKHIIDGLMQTENLEPVEASTQQIERIWHGEPLEDLPEVRETAGSTKTTVAEPHKNTSPLRKRLEQPMSRRELLRGMFSEDSHK